MSFLRTLELRAASGPESLAFTFLQDGEQEESRLTYAELLQRTREVGGMLQEAGARGERVLLLFPPGLDYVVAFLGCLQAGAVAVPAYPPDPMRLGRTLPRLDALTADAQARFVLAPEFIHEMAGGLFEQARALAGARWLSLESARPEHASAWRDPGVTPETVAFLQYTSGSTGSPRGVVLTHGNLLHNSDAIQRCFEHGPDSVGVIWLPPYHDMGLIGGILQPLHAGFPVVLMSPLDFLARPLRWLEAVSRYRATTSGGPNFAYELCVRKVTPEQLSRLDLSSWSLAFNGAEPLHPATLERFRETFAPCGFRAEAMYPCYGLAEGTLIATGGRKSARPVYRAFRKDALARDEVVAAPAEDEAARLLVGCGARLADQELHIVEPRGLRALPEGRVGEVWLRGPSIARGYWNRPDETRDTFQARRADAPEAGPYLRTGDLGFLQDGELFVTGRLKDLLIIRGRNHYPQDLERTAVACHPALRPGCSAVFGVDAGGGEQVVLVQEVDTRQSFDAEALTKRVREALTAEHGVPVHAVVLIEPGSLPKTSSGKVQRRASRQAWLEGQLAVVASDAREVERAPEDVSGDTASAPPSREVLGSLPPEARLARLEPWLRARAASALRVSASRVDGAAPLVQLGLDSLGSVELRADIESALGVSIPLPELLGGLTLAELARRCAESMERGPGERDAPVPVPHDADLPLSFPQEEMWLASRLDASGGGYNISTALSLRGEVRPSLLEAAFLEIIRRHEALRTCFPEVDGKPVQRVLPPSAVPLPVEDLRPLDAGAREARVRQVALDEARAPFSLQHGPLLRARLLRLEDARSVLLFTVHHIAADGWSMRLLIQELTALYPALQQDTPPALPVLPYQYADFAVWQRQRLSGEHLESLLGWWRAELAGLPAELKLPTDREPSGPPDARGGTHSVLLPAELLARLQEACARHHVTPFMWMLAGFQTLLARTTGQEDVPVGVADLGRGVPGSERLIGNFVNMLVMRARLGGDPVFADVLRAVRDTALRAAAHAELPFEQLARGRPPLFRAAFGTQNQPRERLSLPGLEVEPLLFDTGVSRLDLTLWASETPEGLRCHWTYATRLFDASSVERLHRQFLGLLEATLARPETRLAALPLEAADDASVKGALGRLGARRRPVKLTRAALTGTRLPDGETYPLIIEPRVEGLELVAWAREHRAYLEEELTRVGGVLLRGFRMEGVDGFADFVRATSGSPLPYTERSSPREVVKDQVYTSTSHPSDQEIFPHTEQSYNLTFPQKIYFHCVTASPVGGATPISCTRRILRELPREVVERFVARGYRYVRNFGEGLGLSWQEAFQTTERAEVERYCAESQIELQWGEHGRLRTSQVRRCVARHPGSGELAWFNHATFFHVSTLPPALVAHLRGLYREEEMPNNTFYGDGSPIEPEVLELLRAAYVRARVAVPWRPGDVLMLDNMLMAHGREPFRGDRKVVVAMTDPRSWTDVAFNGPLPG